MNNSTRIFLSALTMTFATSAAFAQKSPTDLQRVEVSGQKLAEVTRFDVSKVCADVAQSLQDSLGYAAYREDLVGTVRMQFRLNGSKIEDVTAASGPREYRMAARRAVRNLDCADASSSQPQQFSFLISFNRPADASTGQSRVVALLEE